jgi:hypothetical protein
VAALATPKQIANVDTDDLNRRVRKELGSDGDPCD